MIPLCSSRSGSEVWPDDHRVAGEPGLLEEALGGLVQSAGSCVGEVGLDADPLDEQLYVEFFVDEREDLDAGGEHERLGVRPERSLAGDRARHSARLAPQACLQDRCLWC